MTKNYQWSTDKEFKKWLKDHNKLEAWEAQMRDEARPNYGLDKYMILSLKEDYSGIFCGTERDAEDIKYDKI